MPAEHRTRIRVSPGGEIEVDLTGFDTDELGKAIDVLQSKGIIPQNQPSPSTTTEYKPTTSRAGSANESTLKERLQLFLKFNFPSRWFDSTEVKRVFDEEYADSIRPSTVSTYLSRLADEGFLERKGKRNQRRYRLLEEAADTGPINHELGERALE